MITIDEAIAYERQQVKDKRNEYYTFGIQKSKECAGEHEQIAEWLEELKMLRELKAEHRKIGNIEGFNKGYNKAIDDCIKEVEEEGKQHNHTITKDCLFWLKRKFEQLKAGDNNADSN